MNVYGRKSLSNIKRYKVEFDYQNVNQNDIHKLDANECSNVISKDDISEIFDNMIDIDTGYYPDSNYSNLIKAVKGVFSLSEENIIIGNGTDEIINNLFVAYYGKKLLIPDITYPVYESLASVYEMDVITVPLDKNDFSLPNNIEKYFNKGIDIAAFSYPNNPTGNCFDKKLILSLIKKYPKTLFLIDEAYYEFSSNTFIDEVKEYKNIIVTRTLSKAFGMAGLRLGFGYANVDLIDVLKKIELPYNINIISQALGVSLMIKANSNLLESVKKILIERDRVNKKLNDIEAFCVYPSDANFIFIKLSDSIDHKILSKLLKNDGVYLRFFEYEGIGVFIRFTIGEYQSNEMALNCVLNNIEKCLKSEKILEEYI